MKLYNLSIEIEIPVFAEGRASAERMAGRITREMDHLVDAFAREMSCAEAQSILDGSHDLSGAYIYHDSSRHSDVSAEDAAREHLTASEGETT